MAGPSSTYIKATYAGDEDGFLTEKFASTSDSIEDIINNKIDELVSLAQRSAGEALQAFSNINYDNVFGGDQISKLEQYPTTPTTTGGPAASSLIMTTRAATETDY